MSLLRSTWAVLKSFQRVPFARRSTAGGINVNRGLVSATEMGDSFTEPAVYRNRKNVTAMLKSRRKERRLLSNERTKMEMDRLRISTQTEEGLCTGRTSPRTANEMRAEKFLSDAVVEERGSAEDYSTEMSRLMQRETERRDAMVAKYGQAPTSREFHKLFQNLRASDDDDDAVERHQRRLVEENGIYPSTRIDAYMLDDDSHFPDWVNALPYRIRDRVKYGSLGLTEEDEALRVRLGQLSRDRRLREWKRLKSAKEYKAANEEMLTLSELRDCRQGKRRFHWLQRKRQKRAATLRRMALRKPDGFEQWPSSIVDHSQRIAFIAQHVENGVETKGQWPLDPQALATAKIKRRQDEADRSFLASMEEQSMLKKASASSEVQQLLNSFEKPEKRYKRLSRKTYANRVNAIVHGDQDEHGRKYRKMLGLSKKRQRPYESFSEMALEREVRKEPMVHTAGLHHTDDEHWVRHHKSWADGMPSTRYGS